MVTAIWVVIGIMWYVMIMGWTKRILKGIPSKNWHSTGDDIIYVSNPLHWVSGACPLSGEPEGCWEDGAVAGKCCCDDSGFYSMIWPVLLIVTIGYKIIYYTTYKPLNLLYKATSKEK